MRNVIKINARSSQPKYRQLVETIITSIENGTIKRGQQLPSINELAEEHQLAKATVAKSYDELRGRGVIISKHGKGFYVSSTKVRNSLNIFVLFDTLNAYKEVLYNAFKRHLPADTGLSIFFHHHNRDVFEALIADNLGDFNYYLIMPHLDEDVSGILKKIPKEKLVIIDRDVRSLDRGYAAVYQDFEKDIFSALEGQLERLKKYKKIVLVKGKDHFQYIPVELLRGFRKFSVRSGMKSVIVDMLDVNALEKGAVYLMFSDNDLVKFIKHATKIHWKLGSDVGLISYDDTPLKEILAGGVSVITTDFEAMGRTAAQLVLSKTAQKIANPMQFIIRSTV